MKRKLYVFVIAILMIAFKPGASQAQIAFNVLIDVNQLSLEEATSPTFSNLAANGIWSITRNGWSLTKGAAGDQYRLNDATWQHVFALLGTKHLVSEDMWGEPGQSWYDATRYSGRNPDAAMIYNDSQPQYQSLCNNTAEQYNDLCTAQIAQVAPGHNNSIVVLNRGYWGPYYTHLQMAMNDPLCTGVCFEVIADAGNMQQQNIAAGIKDVLKLGKNCYVLLSPNNPNGTTYLQKVQSAMSYLRMNSVPLHSGKLYLVVACYERQRPTRVGFLAANYNGNSMEAAVSWLKTTPEYFSTPLYFYRNSVSGDNLLTTNWNELGSGAYGYVYKGIGCYVSSSNVAAGTVPLYRYSTQGYHLYTTNYAELGSGKNGWVLEGIQCYVCPNQNTGTVPLYRYRNAKNPDHYYSTTKLTGTAANGWIYEGIQCYVMAQ